MKFKINPYYSPDKCGLEIFESIDTAYDHEFNMFVIWRKLDDNTLWWDTDTGNDCLCPFDNSSYGHDLKPITKETWNNFKNALKTHLGIKQIDINNITKKVKDYLINNKQKQKQTWD